MVSGRRVGHVLTYNPPITSFSLSWPAIVWSLGNRELILRSPSLFGSVIYLLVAYLLCRRLFGQGVLFFLSVAMLSLNPQSSISCPGARYILGLAGLATSMYLMARLTERANLTLQTGVEMGCLISRRFRLRFGGSQLYDAVPPRARLTF